MLQYCWIIGVGGVDEEEIYNCVNINTTVVGCGVD
jgi:hypothetical protein